MLGYWDITWICAGIDITWIYNKIYAIYYTEAQSVIRKSTITSSQDVRGNVWLSRVNLCCYKQQTGSKIMDPKIRWIVLFVFVICPTSTALKFGFRANFYRLCTFIILFTCFVREKSGCKTLRYFKIRFKG